MDIKYDYDEGTYVAKERIGKQTFFMEFQVIDETDDTVYLNIAMGVYNKRKHADRNEDEARMTGLMPFATVKTAIKAFDLLERKALVREFASFDKVHISCCWVDNRRRDVYYKFLSTRGYQYGRLDGQKVIYKLVDRSDYYND